MSDVPDPLRTLARALDDVGPLVAPAAAVAQLSALCATLRLALAAAAVSVARLDADALAYLAADGAGAAAIVATRLSIGRGIAGYVARTGQALAVEHVADDPRFARDVAERTGYVPTTILVVPVVAASGAVLGVVSVLDRGATGVDPLAVASASARQAALVLPSVDAVTGLGADVLRSLAASLHGGDASGLADALRARADEAVDDDEADERAIMLRVVALLSDLRAAGPTAIEAAERVLVELATLARRRR